MEMKVNTSKQKSEFAYVVWVKNICFSFEKHISYNCRWVFMFHHDLHLLSSSFLKQKAWIKITALVWISHIYKSLSHQMSALLMNKITPSATEKINKKFAPSDSEKETNI